MHKDASKFGVTLDWTLLIFEFEVFSFRIKISLAAAEVNHEDLVLLISQSDQEVVRLDVVVDQTFGMHPLDSLQHLVSNQKHALQSKGTLAIAQ